MYEQEKTSPSWKRKKTRVNKEKRVSESLIPEGKQSGGSNLWGPYVRSSPYLLEKWGGMEDGVGLKKEFTNKLECNRSGRGL